MLDYQLKPLERFKYFDVDKSAFEEEIAHDAEQLLKENMRLLKPGADGLYPHELLMLTYAEHYKHGQVDFPSFWRLQFGVYYPEEILDKLVEKDLIRVSPLTADYIYTEKGRQIAQKYDYLRFVYEHPFSNIGIWNAFQSMERGVASIRDIIWQRYNSFCFAFLQSKNYTGYRNIRQNMAEYMMFEMNFEGALKILLEIAYIDLSGVDFAFSATKLARQLNSYFPYETTKLQVSQIIVDYIQLCLQQVHVPRADFISMFQNAMKSIKLPYHVFLQEECVDILFSQVFPTNNYDDELLYDIYEEAEDRTIKWLKANCAV